MIPADVKSMATLTWKKLLIERHKGEVTPEHGKTARTICEEYERKFGIAVRPEKDFWEVAHYIRAVMREPLGSNGTGYFACLTKGEWDTVANDLRERRKKQGEAIDGPTLKFAERSQTELLQDAVRTHWPDAVEVRG